MALGTMLMLGGVASAQKVAFEEFTLDNGLHVILHNDASAPVIITSVMYHVGSKNENPERTGFAHFFEHLLFEGTENIKRGEWFKIVTANGGTNNANTSEDRTYYYEVFPSNSLELGLWMESERMMHPIINQIGVDTQNEVVKEEKRLRVDNQPYGSLIAEVKKNMYVKHPYRWATIGSMDHLDAAKLEEFQAFNKKFYVPNNAVLVVAGDLNDIPKTKEWVNKYFGAIPKGKDIVVEKFVEFYGEGLKNLTLADRATIANMAPEYGATCGFFPIDEETLKYLRFSGRDENTVNIVEKYAKEQGLWANDQVEFTDTLSLDMSTVVPTISGPKRPQDKVLLTDASTGFKKVFEDATNRKEQHVSKVSGTDYEIKDGSILIAAITSCTNTSNPNVLIGAGLLAKKAVELGLETKPWVKTSLAPGSQVVTDYLAKAGLNVFLDKLGFNLVGYGCTTCIGNSGPLPEEIVQAIDKENIYAVSVLSGNRNFEGRISPHIKANYLASPPLVVAYALAGHMEFDLYKEPLGKSKDGKDVFLKDIWPSNKEIEDTLRESLNAEMFVKRYSNVSEGPKQWQEIKTENTSIYNWDSGSTYVKKPPFFENLSDQPEGFKSIKDARPLLILGDMVTTDHISPAGNIQKESPTGEYFMEHQILPTDYNSYGSRRGNHEVMMRGTFANIRIRNEMAPGTEGGFTKLYPEEKVMPVYNAVEEYKKRGTDLVVIGGKEYGTGSSRDWAAKGTKLLGVKVVIAESFERIHRSNLIGMGVLPLQFTEGHDRVNLKLIGSELITVLQIEEGINASDHVQVEIKYASGDIKKIKTLCRIDTKNELEYYKNGGILQYVLRNMI